MFCETNNEEAVFEQLIVQGDERLFFGKGNRKVFDVQDEWIW